MTNPPQSAKGIMDDPDIQRISKGLPQSDTKLKQYRIENNDFSVYYHIPEAALTQLLLEARINELQAFKMVYATSLNKEAFEAIKGRIAQLKVLGDSNG